MVITWQTIITIASVLGALTAIAAFVVKLVHWLDRQKAQDEEIQALRVLHNKDMANQNVELTMLTYGVLACLKGLKEKGCNGPVTEAINKIEKHLNQAAHK